MSRYLKTTSTHDQHKDVQSIRHTFKCVFLGSSGSGKSSIVQQYMVARFNPFTIPTIGAAFNAKMVPTKSLGLVRLEIWDTAGQERFESLIPMYYRGSKIAFVVYDITSRESYTKAKKWVDKIRKETTEPPLFVLVGNKIDVEECRSVSAPEAKKYADDNQILFKECSAKTGHNINKIFEEAYTLAADRINTCKSITIDIPDSDKNINLNENAQNSGISGCFGAILNPLFSIYRGISGSVAPELTDDPTKKNSSDTNSTPVV